MFCFINDKNDIKLLCIKNIEVLSNGSTNPADKPHVILLVPALASISVYEYSATLVKKSLVGTGHATKEQIAMMVRTLLPGAALEKFDAADALAVGVCHAHHRSSPGFSTDVSAGTGTARVGGIIP